MTNQEIFDKVTKHLLTQKIAAMVGTGCAYRAGARSCAVGALIPDDLYTPEIEGKSVGSSINGQQLASVLIQAGFTSDQFSLLRDLQRVHDRLMPRATDKPHPNPMGRALCGLRLVAAQHKLACPEYELFELDEVLDFLEYVKCPLPTK